MQLNGLDGLEDIRHNKMLYSDKKIANFNVKEAA